MPRLVSLEESRALPVQCSMSESSHSQFNIVFSDSTYDEQEKGWNDIESWYEKEKRVQPQGGSFFYSSGYFWPCK